MTMKYSSTPWWRTDGYTHDIPMPVEFVDFAGPKGPALVRAWPSGVTDPGWGLKPPEGSTEGFMPRYERGEFLDRRVLHGFERGRWAFAFIMRSVRLVCVDIDGKNGGLEHAKRLGALPPTLAETSKSGDGYHLFYLVDESWDPVKGYGLLSDRIGLEQGVDIRATGCVYHHKQQRWNLRSVALLPDHLFDLLRSRDQKIEATTNRITSILEGEDMTEILLMQDELESELAKPIPVGKRNNTLFAIGSQMCTAQVPNWQDKLDSRATQLGLDKDEVDKLIGNIERYA